MKRRLLHFVTWNLPLFNQCTNRHLSLPPLSIFPFRFFLLSMHKSTRHSLHKCMDYGSFGGGYWLCTCSKAISQQWMAFTSWHWWTFKLRSNEIPANSIRALMAQISKWKIRGNIKLSALTVEWMAIFTRNWEYWMNMSLTVSHQNYYLCSSRVRHQ